MAKGLRWFVVLGMVLGLFCFSVNECRLVAQDGSDETCEQECNDETCDNKEACENESQTQDVTAALATTDEVESIDEEVSKDKESSSSKQSFTNTHKQNGILIPKHNGESVQLSTFRVRPDGHIVACVTPVSKGKDDLEGMVQVYDSDFQLIDEYPVPFSPTAIDLDASGNMYVAGSGTVVRLDRTGSLAASRNAPNMDDVEMEELREEIAEAMKEEQEEITKYYNEEIEKIEKRIAEIEAMEESERTKEQVATLESASLQLKSYQQALEQQTSEIDDKAIDQRMKYSSRVTAVAVGGKDVFVATSARSGGGYEVYRMTTELDESKRVLKKLRGCCGQMDIHAKDDKIYVAENTKFQVGIYDRDGEKVSSFGERLRKKNQGFGSCCNPMNVMCCDNGDILTAESSIGKIKRFNADGKLIGYIGRARIGGGCKHVAFGHDEKLDRYYVQYEDKNHICVLDPNSSIVEKSSPELAKMTELLTRGTWRLASTQTKKNVDAESDVREGIGVDLETNDDGQVVVKEVIPGSPADKKNISAGDQILFVGEIFDKMQSTEDLDAEEVANLLQGKSGVGVRLRYRSAKSGKKRRTKLVRAKMERVDDAWVVTAGGQDFGFDPTELTNMKTLQFSKDGKVKYEMQSANSMMIGDPSGGQNWVPTKVQDDTLYLDIESAADEMITYRIKAKFNGPDQAEISVTYDGFGDEGEFRNFELENSEQKKDEESETD